MKKKPKSSAGGTKNQKKLIDLAIRSNTRLANNIYGIFLVRQGLRQRSEQFMAIAMGHGQAVNFCRNTLTPKYCNENSKNSLHFIDNGNEYLKVNFDNSRLMIKGLDFVRTEEGRSNNNPLWYWNIAKINIVRNQKEQYSKLF